MIPNWKKGIDKIRNKHIRGRPWFGAKVRKSRFILGTTGKGSNKYVQKRIKEKIQRNSTGRHQRFDVAEEDVRDRL